MKCAFNKKRFWLIIAILVVIEAIGLCLAMRWKYIFPSHEVSEIYKHYQNVQGVDASFIKDFKINDSVFIDVTLLEAQDSAGWATLKHDFSVPELDDELQQRIDGGEDLIFSHQLTSNDYPISISPDSILFDVFAVSFYSHTLTIFHAKDKKDILAVHHQNYQESINQ